MALEEFKNPKTRKTEYVISGKVTAIYFNELKEVKDYGRDGKSWRPTHSVSIVVDGDKVNLGLTEKEVIRVRGLDGDYMDLAKGMEITVSVNKSEYNGKPQYGGYTKDITVISTEGVEKAAAASAQQFSKPYAAAKKDFSGIYTGHAINVAMNVLGNISDPSRVIETAKEAHTLTNKLKSEWAEKHPDMSEYDLGASVGHAVLSASLFVNFVADIEGLARTTLEVIVPAVSSFVKGEVSESEEPAKTATVKKAPKKVAKKPDPVVEVDDSDIPESSFDDTEDDIPF